MLQFPRDYSQVAERMQNSDILAGILRRDQWRKDIPMIKDLKTSLHGQLGMLQQKLVRIAEHEWEADFFFMPWYLKCT